MPTGVYIRIKPRSPETQAKINLANTGKKRSAETREKQRLAKLGKKRGPHSEETKEKIRLSNIGTKHKPETIEKLKIIHKDLWKNEQYRAKMAEVRAPMYIKRTYPREIRTCLCGCLQTFECIITSKKKYVSGHNTIVNWKCPQFRKQLCGNGLSFFEKTIIDLCEKHSLPFKYVGNRQLLIEKKNPDFVDTNGHKLLIEVYGTYQKTYYFGSNENYETIRREIFERNGYQVMFLTETDIFEKDHINCIKKVKDFYERCVGKSVECV